MFPTAARGLSHPDDFDPPDTGFRVGIGVYLAAILTGTALVAGVALNASSGILVATVPTTLSIGLVVGSALAARANGLPERTGCSGRLTAAWFVPAVAFAGVAFAAVFLPSIPTAIALASGLATVAALFGAAVVATMARTRYVAAITPDDPVAAWQWRSPNRALCLYALAICYFALGFVTREISYLTVQWFLFGLLFLAQGLEVSGRLDRLDVDLGGARTARELRIHEAGLVAAGPTGTRLVPWTDIGSVSLTDERLVLERSWLDLRCDRSVIDDPEGVRAAIEQRRNRAAGLDCA
ncbi:PH domain-containing protein [Natrinema marinum]|uniref:PH domain-containing protein n=1 Tax=Natrinema marinum TaxID=2961598 RepID=UPI0020C8D201|nr:PH domain-containing protein [Natrinema marinum]